MQKKLIALAIAGLASGGAFAQSTVTISGLFDVGYQNFKLQSVAAGPDDTVQHFGSSSNAGTTNVTFQATEDLGGGMKAGVLLETDPTAGTATGAAFMNSQNYLWVTGNWGGLKLGFFNNQAFGTATVMQPLGSGIGGGMHGLFGRLDGANVIGAPAAVVGVADAVSVTDVASHGGAGARDIRINNAMEYTTPTWSGFKASFLYKAQNSNGGAGTGNDGQSIVQAGYSNGPLNISYAKSQLSGIAAGVGANQLVHNLLGANYTFGMVTLYGGWTSSKSNLNPVAGTAGNVDSRSWNVALKWQATPALAVIGNVIRVDDKLVGNQDRNLNALRLNYSMSKRTTAYAHYENGDNDKANAASGDFKRFAAGLMHTF